VFSILVPLSLESTVVTTTDLLVVVVVGGGLVVVVVVVTTSGRDVGGEVRERRAMQGVSLQTRRSLLPPLQAAPPPAAATATPLVRTFGIDKIMQDFLLETFIDKIFVYYIQFLKL
jgi:hypothetical protein